MKDDLISRQAAMEELRKCQTYLFDERDPDKKICLKTAEWVLEELPPAQPEVKPIDYRDCADAMLMMWMWNVLTDSEYYRIMDKLNRHETERRNDG